METNPKQIAKKYASLIREVDRAIYPLIESINLEGISKHNTGYKAYEPDKFKNFVEVEKARFLNALGTITQEFSQGNICDLGCFIPYLPTALALLGYNVKIVDKYQLYEDRFKGEISKLADSKHIRLCDLDILQDDFHPLGENEVVLLMAVVEHLNGSPRNLMEKARGIISNSGFLLFEVPNIAEFVKRVRMLLGYSPLAPYQDYLQSDYPFMGHNREMTVGEVHQLLAQTGFDCEWVECYDYWKGGVTTLKGSMIQLLKQIAPLRHKAQVISAKARPHK